MADVIEKYMNKLRRSSAFSSTKDLRSLYDIIEYQVRSLNSLGLDQKSYGPMLVPVILSKLPQEFKLTISRSIGKNRWDVDVLLKRFQQELEIREKIEVTENNDFTNSLYTNSEFQKNGAAKGPYPCVYCGRANHKSYECKTVSKLTSRKDILFRRNDVFYV